MKYDIGDEIKYKGKEYVVLGKGVKEVNNRDIDYLILEGINGNETLEISVDDPSINVEVAEEVETSTSEEKINLPEENYKQATKAQSNDNSNKDLIGLYGREEIIENNNVTLVLENEILIDGEIGVASGELEIINDFKPSVTLPISRKVKTAFPKKVRVKKPELIIEEQPEIEEVVEFNAPIEEVNESTELNKNTEIPKWFTEEFKYVNYYRTNNYSEPVKNHKLPSKNVIEKAFNYNETQRKVVTNEIRTEPNKLKAPSKYYKELPLVTKNKIGVVNYEPSEPIIKKEFVKEETIIKEIPLEKEIFITIPVENNEQVNETKMPGTPILPTEKIIYEIKPEVEISKHVVLKYEDFEKVEQEEEDIFDSLQKESWYDKITKFKFRKNK